MLYHRPRFAVLDEATAAVDVPLEEKCMRACQDRGITLCSIATRLSQKQFHQHLLKLDGKKGYKVGLRSRNLSLFHVLIRFLSCLLRFSFWLFLFCFYAISFFFRFDSSWFLLISSSLAVKFCLFRSLRSLCSLFLVSFSCLLFLRFLVPRMNPWLFPKEVMALKSESAFLYSSLVFSLPSSLFLSLPCCSLDPWSRGWIRHWVKKPALLFP